MNVLKYFIFEYINMIKRKKKINFLVRKIRSIEMPYRLKMLLNFKQVINKKN